ncbi:MAG: hypothetical protein OXH99_01705 [Bryobacterales bacterium]|nr:hypothetical protein [Bryobacterales bacterium]
MSGPIVHEPPPLDEVGAGAAGGARRVRIHPQPQPPHRAEATYELVEADGRGG